MSKRIIAFLLCIVMAAGLLPIGVFAAEADTLANFTKRNTYTAKTFYDVQTHDWFFENVKSVYELGLMQGKGNNRFDSESGITIAEALTIAARLHSIYFNGTESFKTSDPWYQVYADYCAANGIASVKKGYLQSASRAEFVVILVNAFPSEEFAEINIVADNAIPDVNINDSYGAAVYKMYRAGIMVGNDEIGTFAPSSKISRSEVAAIITRMVDVSLRKSIQLGEKAASTNNTIYCKSLDRNHIRTGMLEFEGEQYEGQYIDNELIVITNDISSKELEQLLITYRGKIVGQIPAAGSYQIEFNESYSCTELSSIASDLEDDPHIKKVFLNTVSSYSNTAYYPNDMTGSPIKAPYDSAESYAVWWETYLWGQSACNVPQAWEIILKVDPNPSIRLGFIDSCFDANHEDLYIEGVKYHSEKFDPRTIIYNDPISAEHGTHVAGIMGARSDNKKGISGVALNAKLYGVSINNLDIPFSDKNLTVPDFVWAADLCCLIEAGTNGNNEPTVINVSQGTIGNDGVNLAVKYAAMIAAEHLTSYYNLGYNYLLVQAAGNDGNDSGDDTNYNSFLANISEKYLRDRIIVVGNARQAGTLYCRKESSSYRGGRVDVMAPGTDIYSTMPQNTYSRKSLDGSAMDGTSMAAPFVAGLAGLIWEADPSLTAERVKEIIVSTANIDVADSDANMVNAEAAVIKALGYDPRTKVITFRFVDTSTSSAIKAQTVSWNCVEYSPKYAFHPRIGINDLKNNVVILNGDKNTAIDAVNYSMPYGEFRFAFKSPGYLDTTVTFAVDNDTDEVVIYMVPESAATPVAPDLSTGSTISGEFVYLNDRGAEIPVPLAKAQFTDVTNSNIIYSADIVNGQLNYASFDGPGSSDVPPDGTYNFYLVGCDKDGIIAGDKDENGFYTLKELCNVKLNGKLDMGKVYCDRVAEVSCSVVDPSGTPLNSVSMTITQNGNMVESISSFRSIFSVPLAKGDYTLTLTCNGYKTVTKKFTVNGTTDLGKIRMDDVWEQITDIHIADML